MQQLKELNRALIMIFYLSTGDSLETALMEVDGSKTANG